MVLITHRNVWRSGRGKTSVLEVPRNVLLLYVQRFKCSVWDPDLLAESRIKTTGSGFRSDPELRDSKISVHPKNFYILGNVKKMFSNKK